MSKMGHDKATCITRGMRMELPSFVSYAGNPAGFSSIDAYLELRLKH